MNAHNCPPGTLLLASSPCPWCGKPPKSIDTGTRIAPWWYTRCVNAKCPVMPCTGGRRTKEESESAWCERKAQ